MLYLLVQVNESIKRIVPEHVVSIEFTNNQFSDLFGAVTSGEYGDREVEVFLDVKSLKAGKSHHKKNPLSQQKLVYLSSSLELSVSQPWANNDVWNQVIPATLSLIEILKKYAEYLTIITTNMNILHYSDGSARNSENDCTMYRIIACKNENLNDIYSQLNDVLLEKQIFRSDQINLICSSDSDQKKFDLNKSD
ncbi:unnamed protein product [Rhizophagus irregularis]|uniref:Uncharacterized protein n=1 Tax=Rhizophagus irregularis TaxID=588596 RepID=A0A916EE19_9GLOM|nr:unnamed protein product [Rhizophagus irregularis]